MRETLEREIKLLPGDGLRDARARRPSTAAARSSRRTTTPPTCGSCAHGITLRHRVEGGEGIGSSSCRAARPGWSSSSRARPPIPPADVLALLVAHLRGHELVPVARLRTRRETASPTGPRSSTTPSRCWRGLSVVRRFRELEIELVEGTEVELTGLEGPVVLSGRSGRRVRPKLYRALGLAPSAPRRPRASRRRCTGRRARHRARARVTPLLAHDPGARRGDDPEDLHQLRVSVRRLRAFLRTARRLVDPEWARSLRDELRWLGSALGPARDLDVMLERFVTMCAPSAPMAPRPRDFSRLSKRSAPRPTGGRRNARERALPTRSSSASEGTVAPPLSDGDEALATSWRRETKRMYKAFRRLGSAPADSGVHAARIAVKRARYAAELSAHELGGPGARFVSAAKAPGHPRRPSGRVRLRGEDPAVAGASSRRGPSPPGGS